MIKRIIFDVDDTLIPWKKEYFVELKKVLEKNNIKLSKFRFLVVLKAINRYEKTHKCWNIDEFKKDMSKKSKVEITDERYKLIINWLENCVYGEASQELKDTLKYLSKKYELVILSNSFKSVQEKRLEKYKVAKYFKELYCGDVAMKPNPKVYMDACGKYQPSECIMVGDNLDFDVKVPSKLGIKSIYVNEKKHKKFTTVKSVVELKEML